MNINKISYCKRRGIEDRIKSFLFDVVVNKKYIKGKYVFVVPEGEEFNTIALFYSYMKNIKNKFSFLLRTIYLNDFKVDIKVISNVQFEKRYVGVRDISAIIALYNDKESIQSISSSSFYSYNTDKVIF